MFVVALKNAMLAESAFGVSFAITLLPTGDKRPDTPPNIVLPEDPRHPWTIALEQEEAAENGGANGIAS